MNDSEIEYMGTRHPTFVSAITLDCEDPSCSLTFDRSKSSDVFIGRRPSDSDGDASSSADGAVFRCAVVSRKHAKIAFSDSGHVYLIDLTSCHGTHIRKAHEATSRMLKPETATRLFDGDVVTFGKSVERGKRVVRPVVARIRLTYDRPPPIHIDLTTTSTNRYGIFDDDDDDSQSSSSDSDIQEIPASGPNALPLPPRSTDSAISRFLIRLLPPAPAHNPSADHPPITVYTPSTTIVSIPPSPRSAYYPRSPCWPGDEDKERSHSPMDLASTSPSPYTAPIPLEEDPNVIGAFPSSPSPTSEAQPPPNPSMSIESICWSQGDVVDQVDYNDTKGKDKPHDDDAQQSSPGSDPEHDASDDLDWIMPPFNQIIRDSPSQDDLLPKPSWLPDDNNSGQKDIAPTDISWLISDNRDDEQGERAAIKGISSSKDSLWSSASQDGSFSTPASEPETEPQAQAQSEPNDASSSVNVEKDKSDADVVEFATSTKDILDEGKNWSWAKEMGSLYAEEEEEEEEEEEDTEHERENDDTDKANKDDSEFTDQPPKLQTLSSPVIEKLREYKARSDSRVHLTTSKLSSLSGRVDALEGLRHEIDELSARIERHDDSSSSSQVAAEEREEKEKEKEKVEFYIKTLRTLVDEMRILYASTTAKLEAELKLVTTAREAAIARIQEQVDAVVGHAEQPAQASSSPSKSQEYFAVEQRRARASSSGSSDTREILSTKRKRLSEYETASPSSSSDEEVGGGGGVRSIKRARARDTPIPSTPTPTFALKRKRSADDDEEVEDIPAGDATVPTHRGRAIKRARRVAGIAVQTATAVTVGAIAAWGALAFS